jgi:hypothetical protein
MPLLFSAVALRAVLAACSGGGATDGGAGDTDTDGGDAGSPSPIVTGIGAAMGPAATSTIGLSGSVLLSPDSRLTVTVPRNALAATTTISVQPITSHRVERVRRPRLVAIEEELPQADRRRASATHRKIGGREGSSALVDLRSLRA